MKLALRMLLKTPFVTTVAVVSLALGIGANSAIFSLFDQLLLRPLPVERPRDLVNLGTPGPKPGSNSCNDAGSCDVVFSYPMFRDLEREQTVFTGLAAHRLFNANFAYNGQTSNGSGMLVSGAYFSVLGLKPQAGRLLGPDDDARVGKSHVAVLADRYWRKRFNGDSGVVNQTLLINGQSMTVVGIAPAGFFGTTKGSEPDVFVPITMRGLMDPPFKGFEERRAYWAYVFGRLKPGVSIEQARLAINQPYHAIINSVEAPLQKGMSEQTMALFKAKVLTVEPGARGQSSIHEQAQTPLIMLFSVTGVVLLIACANIANLLLARSAGRAGEMAVRLAIGASRRQLVKQLLLESCLLAVVGGLAGLLVARWTLALIGSLLPVDAATTLTFALDGTMILFATALSLGTGVLFGLFPALHSTRPDLASTLKTQAGQPSGARAASRFRTSLVVSQIALSMALLACAGLFIKSLINVSRVDLGIKIDHLLTFRIAPRLNGYTPERSRELAARLEDELRTIPGVSTATGSMVPLLSGSNWGSNVTVQGFQAGPDTDTNANFNEIGPDYFKTLAIPMLAGREFTISDSIGAPKVVVINEAFLKKFNLGRDAVGMRMKRGGGTDLDLEIVGIVPNAKYADVKEKVQPVFYTPYRQDSQIGALNFYLRTSGDPETVLKAVPPVVARVDPNLPVVDLRTMPQQVRENVFLDRLISLLSTAFAGLATLLAAVGLYGVLAYTVSQRIREFGLRMALGADPSRVRRLVLGQVARLAVVGGAIGLLLAGGAGYGLRAQLSELQSYDPFVLASAAVFLGLVALGAGLIPAVRASRIDPMRALRYE